MELIPLSPLRGRATTCLAGSRFNRGYGVIRFLIDPQHVKEAVLTGRCLMVEIHGNRNQYRKVTVISRKDYPNITPSDEAVVRAA